MPIAIILFVLALALHLYVLFRANHYWLDRDATLPSVAQFARYLNESPASGWDYGRYAPEGHRWVSWSRFTTFLAAAALISLVVSVGR
jgi:hypothetical protein